jgi:hypothetical protein
MKIYKRWYPKALSERADWHENFAAHAAESGKDHGLSDAEVSQTEIDAQVVRAFQNQDVYIDAETDRWRKARDGYLDGNRGSAEPDMAEFNLDALPAGAMVAIAERTERYALKIEASDTFSDSVAAAFGILAPAESSLADEDAKPVAKVSATAQFKVAIRIPLKGMGGIQSEMERDGDPQTHKTIYTSGDITDETPLLVAGQPETRRYRFYYLRKNKVVGESSVITEVTLHA